MHRFLFTSSKRTNPESSREYENKILIETAKKVSFLFVRRKRALSILLFKVYWKN